MKRSKTRILSASLFGVLLSNIQASETLMKEDFEKPENEIKSTWSLPENSMILTENAQERKSFLNIKAKEQRIFAKFYLPLETGKNYYGKVKMRYDCPSSYAVFFMGFADKEKKWISGGVFPRELKGIQKTWKEYTLPPTPRAPKDAYYLEIFLGIEGSGSADFTDLEIKEYNASIVCSHPQNESVISDSKPDFKWKVTSPVRLSAIIYLSQNPDFPQDDTFTFFQNKKDKKNSIPCGIALSPGKWFWKVVMLSSRYIQESKTNSFTVDTLQPFKIKQLWKSAPSNEKYPQLSIKIIPTQEMNGINIQIDGIAAKIIRNNNGVVCFAPSSPLDKGMHKVNVSFKGQETKFIYCNKDEGDKISFRKDGILLINNKPFFPVGCLRDPSEFPGLLEAEFNMVHLYDFEDKEPPKIEAVRKYLENAAKNNLKVFMGISRKKIHSCDEEWIENYCAALKDQKSLLAWYLYDEPIACNIPLPTLCKTCQTIKRVDSNHPTLILEYIMHAGEIQDAIINNAVDIFAGDWYPIRSHDFDVLQYEEFIHKTKKAANGKPFWIVLQGQDLNVWDKLSKKPQYPTPQQSRLMAHLALSGGTNGLLWYWGRSKIMGYNVRTDTPEIWKGICDTVNEIKKLIPFLVKERNKYQLELPSDFRYWTAASDGKRVLSVMNVTHEEKTISFSPGKNLKTISRFENGKEIALKDGTIKTSFKPLEVKIYIWDENE